MEKVTASPEMTVRESTFRPLCHLRFPSLHLNPLYSFIILDSSLFVKMTS